MKRPLGSTFLALAMALGMASTAFAAPAFTDVPDTHWASSYIQQAYEKGWVNGMTPTAFAPSAELTRAQFLKMVATAFYPEDLNAAAVPGENPWYTSSWTVAQSHGLQNGTSMSKLSDLTAQISRYDMAQVIANLLAAEDITAASSAVNKQSFQDWNDIPQSYRDAVSAAYMLGILNGKDGKFAGQDTMTRAEAATVLCRMDSVVSGSSGSAPSTQTPAVQTPSTQTTAQTTAAEELAAEVVRLVNVERAKEGLPALETFDSLTQAAQIRAPELITHFSHDRPDGTQCFTALDKTGANKNAYTSGENIAAGNATAAETVEQWMNSPGHRANILNKDFTHIGVAYAQGGSYGHYWVQMFVGTKSVPSTTTPSSQTSDTQTPSAATSTQTPAAQTAASTSDELAAEVVRLVNVERAKEGLPALGTYDSLTQAAQTRAPELITHFSHDRPDGSSCFTALDATGAKTGAYTWGENVAAGSATAAEVVEQWMNSPGHRANILHKDFTHIGVAYCKSDSGYGHYWVQLFVGTNNVPGSTQTPSTHTSGSHTSNEHYEQHHSNARARR